MIPGLSLSPPTTLFGLIPGLGRAVQRFADAVTTWPSWWMVLLGGLALAFYGGFAFLYGRNRGFLEVRNGFDNPVEFVLYAVRLFLVPALVEEIIFRVALLPHPKEGIPGLAVATLGYPEPGAVCSLASAGWPERFIETPGRC